MKVFSEYQKHTMSAKNRIAYSESYQVTYTEQQSNGFWTTKTKLYFTASKGREEQVRKQFEKDMKGKTYRFIKVIYQ